MAQPLSERLREGTKAAHHNAEHSIFIRQFFTGKLPLESYRLYLFQLLHIYSALEEHLTLHRENEAIQPVYFPELHRSTTLTADLNFYSGVNDSNDLVLSYATGDYILHLKELADEWPAGLVAHAYTRYLGDLSGGQVLKRIVMGMYHLNGAGGLAFYEFPQITDQTGFKRMYRSRLDTIILDKPGMDKMVSEAVEAFRLNQAVFDSMLAASETTRK
jgi:heme oxygenase